MSSYTKICCGLVLVLPLTALSLFGVLGAQEPKRDQSKNNSPAERPGQDRSGVPGANNNGPRDFNKGPMPGMGGKGFINPNMTPPRPDKELEAWIKILAEKMTDRNDDIRNSARRALVSVGPAAMFSLKEMTESKDAATAVAARNVMMEIGRSTMQKNMMMQRGSMPFGGPQGMPGMGGWGKMNPQDMNRRAGPGGPPREGDRGARPEAGKPETGRPEGERKAGPANPPREGDKRPEAGKPEAGRPEGERKAGPGGPPREGDKNKRPEAGKPEGDRKANPPREGDRGARPEAGPEAKERMLNELNLSKDVRAKVESIINTQQEKIKDVIAKGREANGDREKIMAEVRELQQNMAMSLKEAMGEEKFKAFMKNAPMFNRGVNPQGRDASR